MASWLLPDYIFPTYRDVTVDFLKSIGIRALLIAAWYCTCDDVADWVYYDTDLGSYTYLCGELRPEFEILCEEAIALARKHGQEHVFLEDIPERVLKIYLEQTQEERDLGRHVREVSAWY